MQPQMINTDSRLESRLGPRFWNMLIVLTALFAIPAWNLPISQPQELSWRVVFVLMLGFVPAMATTLAFQIGRDVFTAARIGILTKTHVLLLVGILCGCVALAWIQIEIPAIQKNFGLLCAAIAIAVHLLRRRRNSNRGSA
jgi:peptidoglycan/LPS O-acetylase OafA/YrhL